MAESTLTRQYRFCAAHRLHSPRLSDEENRKVFGKCNNVHGHGHNYALRVTVSGVIDPHTGHVTDVDALDRIVHETVVVRFDHRDLNRDAGFADKTTTGENLLQLICEMPVNKLPGGRPVKAVIVDTRVWYVECRGRSPQRFSARRSVSLS